MSDAKDEKREWILVQEGRRIGGPYTRPEADAEATKRQSIQEGQGSAPPIEVKQILNG